MISDEDATLYGWYRSSCSWRVRIALAWKGIKYRNIPVNLQNGSQNDTEFQKKNPMEQVPALCVDGLCLAQSVAILEYLEESRPEKPHLLPAGLKERALVRQIVETIVSGIQPHQNLPGTDMPPNTPEKWKMAWDPEWGKMWIEKGFRGLERILKENCGKYCVGDEVTLADVCLVPQVYNAKLHGIDMTPFPTIVKLNDTLVQLDAFRTSHPSLQPDCPQAYRELHF